MTDYRPYLALWETLQRQRDYRADLIRYHKSTALIDYQMIRTRLAILDWEIEHGRKAA